MKCLDEMKGVLFVAFLFISFLCPSDTWRRRRRRPPPVRPIRRPPPKTPTRPPYCPLDPRVKIITQQKKFGREIHEFKRGKSWPYNCLYASILQYRGSFNYLPLIQTCCNSCSFPAFTTCITKYGTSWRCPSQGIQCIVKCVRIHDPNSKPIPPKPIPPKPIPPKPIPPKPIPPKPIPPIGGWRRRIPRIRVRRIPRIRVIRIKPTVNPKCERKVLKGGKFCIERLCIPIKFA